MISSGNELDGVVDKVAASDLTTSLSELDILLY